MKKQLVSILSIMAVALYSSCKKRQSETETRKTPLQASYADVTQMSKTNAQISNRLQNLMSAKLKLNQTSDSPVVNQINLVLDTLTPAQKQLDAAD